MSTRHSPTDFLDRFGAVRKSLNALATQAYATEELGTTQAKLVRAIGRHGKISQAELARATTSDPTLTGRVLDTLIERGFVLRERSEDDRRAYVVELSASGRRVRDRIEKLRAQLAARVVAALDDRDLADFDRIAAKLCAAFEG